MHGKGKLTLTGQLGDVMKESAQAAFSYIRSNVEKYGIEKDSKVEVRGPADALYGAQTQRAVGPRGKGGKAF